MLPHIKAFKNRKNMKNLLLFSTLLLTSVGAMAQLTVKPNGAADSYVYVKNQILYVDGYTNLTLNPTSSNEASIYLREDGQLIQGGTTSNNDGNGFLSVQQNSPDTNAWAYYYWCSPVGNPAATQPMTVGNNKNFGILSIYEDQNATPGIGTNARQSASVTTKEGFTDPQLTISRRWIYTHPTPGTEAEGNYIRINNTNGAKAGYGFTMKGVNPGPIGSPAPPANTSQIYEFRGRPNSGDFNIPVQRPVIGGGGPTPNVNARMTLSGNPYPSALDMNKFFFDLDNTALDAIYYYDEDRTKMTHNYSGKPFGYGVWIPIAPDPYTGGVPNPSAYPGVYTQAPFYIWNAGGGSSGTGNNGTPVNNKRFAPIGQGFMLVGNTASPTDVYIRNSHRIFIKEGAANYSVFQRPDGENYAVEENRGPGLSTASETIEDYRTPQMRLYVTFDEALTRDLVLCFSDQATDGYDRGMDGLSPTSLNTDAYFPVGNDNLRLPYVINSVNYEVNKQIPFAFKLNKTTNIQLRVVEEIKKPYQHAYLFDSQENTYQNLSITGSRPSILNLPAGVYENRFFIVFRSPYIKLDTPKTEVERTELVRANVTFFQNNPQHQLEIRNPEGYTIKTASVYDMSGKLVISEKNLGDDNKYSFYTGNLSDGVYLVKLMTSDDVSIDYKAIVHNQ